MIQRARPLLWVVAFSLVVSASALAQETLSAPRLDDPVAPLGGGVLEALPKVPELPASLFRPAPVLAHGVDPLDVPYFVQDPLLDPVQFSPPGWFAGVELDVLKPHLNNQLTNTVQNATQSGNGTSTTVMLPSAALDFAFSPRVVLGYRLPAGFGEVSFAYRGLTTEGDGSFVDPDGLHALHSRLDFNMFDFDYSAREFSLWPSCGMKWTVGVRTLFLYFDSQTLQSFDQANAGSGIFQMHESNSLVASGPHTALELSYCLADTGLSLFCRTDATLALGRIHQGFSTLATATGPDGLPLGGVTRDRFWMGTPMLSGQFGITWQPPTSPDIRFFLGYQCEYWWDVGLNLDTGGRANLWDSGLMLQAAYRF